MKSYESKEVGTPFQILNSRFSFFSGELYYSFLIPYLKNKFFSLFYIPESVNHSIMSTSETGYCT